MWSCPACRFAAPFKNLCAFHYLHGATHVLLRNNDNIVELISSNTDQSAWNDMASVLLLVFLVQILMLS